MGVPLGITVRFGEGAATPAGFQQNDYRTQNLAVLLSPPNDDLARWVRLIEGYD
jgi:hypothetical protein